jgi:transposase
VRSIVRGATTERHYERDAQPLPKLGAFADALDQMLADNARRGKRERLTFQCLYEALRLSGYSGGYDAVRRYGRAWERRQSIKQAEAYVPLAFSPGEAYQFDWSHECVVIDGVTTMAKVAHVRLCHSRMLFVRAYPRESQEMVFDAHEQAFAFFKGGCQRGIYDNMKTAVDAVFIGKERQFNRRFVQMLSHHLVEPTACTPGAGWEKGQVENQVGVVRRRFFSPRLKFKSYADLNGYLLDRCIAHARSQAHPEQKDKTVFAVFEAERSVLIPYRGPFDGFHATSAAVSKTCLSASTATDTRSPRALSGGRWMCMPMPTASSSSRTALSERTFIASDKRSLGEHRRRFGCDQIAYDPWHYVPVLARKPGALRNGAPFQDWLLPGALAKVRRRLAGFDDGDRQMVKILTAVLTDGLQAVEAACAEALAVGLASADVILNALARRQQEAPAQPIAMPARLALNLPPIADCARYDRLRTPAREAGYGAL